MLTFAYYAMSIVLAVRWHRFVLLDDRDSLFTEILAARNWRYLGYTVLLGVAPLVPVALMFIIGFGAILSGATPAGDENVLSAVVAILGILTWLATIILYVVVLRFSLVLPGAAVDRSLRLGQAWRKMRGNTWRFIGTLILVAIPPLIFAVLLVAVLGLFLFGGTAGDGYEAELSVFVLTNVVTIVIVFFIMVVGVTVLSKTYAHVVGMDAPGGGVTGRPGQP